MDLNVSFANQEHFKTISYAKFGGQTECIKGNSKIVNLHLLTNTVDATVTV